jgi:putative transposase
MKAYKTKLRPTAEQRRYFGGCCGAARFVFNWALADRKEMFEAGGKPNRFEQSNRFNAIKDELCPWIREYPYKLVEAELKHVDAAYQNFFRRIKNGKGGKEAGFPKFKSRYKDKQSFVLRGDFNSVRVENGRIKLPRIGWVNLAEKDYIPEDVKILFVTISERAGQWFISVQVEEEIEQPETNGHMIGVDVGIKSTAVLSDGRSFEAQKTLYKYEKKMARLNRELHRRTKGSSNRAKTKAKVAKLHLKIANVRAHHLHNVSKAVVSSLPAAVVIEDLNIKGMLKNGRLAKALSDAGMGELHRQIEYKTEWSGAELIKAGRFFASSRLCSKCGWYHKELTLADRTYKCGGCGNEIDRDLNAAMNLVAYGEAVKRGGLPVELSGLPDTVKQEGGE